MSALSGTRGFNRKAFNVLLAPLAICLIELVNANPPPLAHRRCILDPMFDERTFRVRDGFLSGPAPLESRFRRAALVNLALSPFLLVFLLIYFFMHNVSQRRFSSCRGGLHTVHEAVRAFSYCLHSCPP